MKVCERCGTEISTKDGVGLCPGCERDEENGKAANAKKRAARKARENVMRDLGLRKVRGALGGTYWE
jgi:uncharacterized Zn finger protein (UPF0148 family)